MNYLNLKRIVKGLGFRIYCVWDFAVCHLYFLFCSIRYKKKYADLNQLKNKYKGERVFLIGTGHSLTVEDVKKLKGEYTFGLNSYACGVDEFGYEPTFYGITDVECLEENFFGREIMKLDTCLIFYPGRRRFDRKKKGEIINKRNSLEYPMLEPGQWTNFARKVPKAFSDDITKEVYYGFTCAYAMMQIAVYMGFAEICLLGMDCIYKPGELNFKDKRDSKEVLEGSHGGKTVSNFILAWDEARKYCEKKGVKVYNVTRGGMLEAFERKDLDSLLK